MPPPYSPGCVDRVAVYVSVCVQCVEPKLQTYFSSYSHGHSRYKWASFAKASGLRAISTLNSARRESVKFARKCECGSGFFDVSTSAAPFDTFGRYCHSVRAYSRASSPGYSPTVARESYDDAVIATHPPVRYSAFRLNVPFSKCTRVCTASLRRDALLDRAGLKLGHGVDEERSGCGNTGGEKERVRAEIERERNVGGTQAAAGIGSGNRGMMGVSWELMKRRRTERGELVVLDEKAVRRDKLRDVQGRHLFERTFLDENNGLPRASIGFHYDDDDDRDDMTPRVPAC
ncbi:hypothetical protein ALC62_10728 [Cyphomyrmex costatus]|uniref:Uncharacterized protein n=1 Tax=Cyphomyrmex costatus TaxID=456900 RepID=A0A195CDI8_9HYME|nr:hypothetical protein ALC62_10728 [Cyphomyrmex costatus]